MDEQTSLRIDTPPESHETTMARALEIAQKGHGRVSPNPMVGCVLVKGGHIVGEGYHHRFGGPHAEVEALADAGIQAKGATVYVTLEPCSHRGKTGPCTAALIEAEVAHVVIAGKDPNKLVSGRGIGALKAAGIGVTVGICAEEAAYLNRGFFTWIQKHRPYTIVKVARTLDNFVAAHPPAGGSGAGWFTSPGSRKIVHRLRAEVDAVMVGRGTAEQDNPALTVRDIQGISPIRIVMDTHDKLPQGLKMFTDNAAPTWVLTHARPDTDTAWGRYIHLPEDDGHLDFEGAVKRLGELGITSLLIEGGPTLHRSAMKRIKIIDEIMIFTAQVSAHKGISPAYLNRIEVPAAWETTSFVENDGDEILVAKSRPSRKISS